MNINCLVAIPNNSLLDRALANIIQGASAELKLLPSSAKDMADLITEIAEQKPDIVIIAESMSLAAKDKLVSLLMSFTELRVVLVSEDTNWLHVFHKRDMLMTRQADLLDVLYFDCLDQV